MRMSRPVTSLFALSLLASATTLVAGAPTAYAAVTCHGQPATIVGHSDAELWGTEGNDVIVTDGADPVRALGGDDLICITGVNGMGQSRIDAGAGNDVVDATETPVEVRVKLGAGSDTYLGTPLSEDVSGGQPDTEKDTITTVAGGSDLIESGSDPTVPNSDVVTVGGDATVFWAGPMAEGGKLAGDNESTLGLTVGSGDVALDSAAGQWTEDGTTLLTWTGFGRYDISGPTKHAPRSFAFTGSDRDEQVALDFQKSYRRPQHITLGGGNDSLLLGEEDSMGSKGSTYDAGPGVDYLATWLGPKVSLDLASGRTERHQDGRRIRTKVVGFEQPLVGAKKLELWGTNGDDVLHFYGCRVTVHARGGDDEVSQSRGDDYFEAGLRCSPRRFELYGGGGNDDLRGSTDNDLLIGGAGRDTINGNAGRDTCSGEKLTSCEVRLR